MADLSIYHNPRCSKSRNTLALLQENGVEPNIILYLETPPTVAALDAIATKLKCEPTEFVRKGEAIYKELGLAGKSLSRQELLQVMIDNPKLIERPIVFDDSRAVIGRPPENALELL